MATIITVSNQGQKITATNYWGSDLDRAGTMHLSMNSGCYRLLLPSGWEAELEEMRKASEVIISRGTLTQAGKSAAGDTLEILFEDKTDNPYSIHLSTAQANAVPPATEVGRWFDFAVWINRRGLPHESLRFQCLFRIVDNLPCLKPWESQ